MNYLYSPTTNAFYLAADSERYKQCGTLPDDATGVEDEAFILFSKEPTGKQRVAGTDGLPAWADTPPLTAEQKAAIFSANKNRLLAEASQSIAPMKDALDGGYIDDADKLRLVAWQKYRYDLSKVTQENQDWPTKPA
ncbi:tail fiber assembly protein [Kosakonia cowanii]|uniref:tail fiber assembly protein n=1 Tax=Kosakonia cowanii TaxID=208223 RepID=UPI003D999121